MFAPILLPDRFDKMNQKLIETSVFFAILRAIRYLEVMSAIFLDLTLIHLSLTISWNSASEYFGICFSVAVVSVSSLLGSDAMVSV